MSLLDLLDDEPTPPKPVAPPTPTPTPPASDPVREALERAPVVPPEELDDEDREAIESIRRGTGDTITDEELGVKLGLDDKEREDLERAIRERHGPDVLIAPRMSAAEVLAGTSGLGSHQLSVAPADIEDLRRHLLGVVASVRAIEVDVGFALPDESEIARASFDDLRAVAGRLSVGVREVLR